MKSSSSKSVYIHRLGCPKVEADLDGLHSLLASNRIEVQDEAESADIAIISSCAFILDSRSEAIDAILEAVSWKAERPDRQIFVTGCLPIHYRDELAAEIPEVDGWYQFNEWQMLLNRIAAASDQDNTVAGIHCGQVTPLVETGIAKHRHGLGPFHAYLRISEGCNRRCSYCAIPSMRGPYRSKPEQLVLTEAKQLLASGVKELILVAQEVNSYGKDLEQASSIERLLGELGNELEKVQGKRWLRILYTHPPLMTEPFIKALAGTPGLVPYLDFPIEHADDTVLKAMRRGTTWAKMRGWIDLLRDSIPDIALRTSIIVGHPGEGPQEFDTLLNRLEEARFERLGVFRYSPEENTFATTQEAPDEDEAFEREAEVLALTEELAEQWYQSRIGKRTEVLIESVEGTELSGRTVWDAPDIDGDAIILSRGKPGDMVTGIITEAEPYRFTLQGD